MRMMSEDLIDADLAVRSNAPPLKMDHLQGANISYGYNELFLKCTYNSRFCDSR